MRRDPYLQESQRVAQLPQREDDLALLRAHLGDLAVNGLDRAARCILHVGVQLDACDLQGRDGALCARAVSSSAGADCTQGIHRHTQTRIVLLTMAVSVVKTLDEWMMLAVVKPCSANTETAPATSGSRSHSRQSIHPSIHTPCSLPSPLADLWCSGLWSSRLQTTCQSPACTRRSPPHCQRPATCPARRRLQRRPW